MTSPQDELLALLNLQSERELTPDEMQQLSLLLSSNEDLIDLYVDYMSVQGLLFWNAGGFPSSPGMPQPATSVAPAAPLKNTPPPARRGLLAVVAALVAVVAVWSSIVDNGPQEPNVAESSFPSETDPTDRPEDGVVTAPPEERVPLPPLRLNGGPPEDSTSETAVADVSAEETAEPDGSMSDLVPDDFDDQFVTAGVDQRIAATLEENDVKPSPQASDAEWLRRVYLTIAGRIPTVAESRPFLESKSVRKRRVALDHVLNLPERSRNLAVIWTNLLVGRSPRHFVNRDKLYDYLRSSFAENQPWIDTVGELITARGRNDENGATNFLLAHLNNQATPATAVTSRLFLGEQLSCVQCHDHPFARDVKQERYWALNAFFKETERASADASLKSQVAGMNSGKGKTWQLVDRRRNDPMTYYETKTGEQRAILPQFDGIAIDRDSAENRRSRLAELLAADSDAKVARAMVNRMWSHFFGFGFTPEVDDMGAHVPVSHPELLDFLAEAFVQSGYDLKRLMRWIGNSQSWNRSSSLIAENADDRPDHGTVPLFSRVYVQRMTPEQVYESVRTAVRSSAGVAVDVDDEEASEAHRREWVAQFAQSYDTDENDEAMHFDGSIAQAMVMMNNVEVSDAIAEATHAMLGDLSSPAAISATLKQIALAMLTREPTAGEQKIFRSHIRSLASKAPAKVAMPNAIEDMMWAYLNSSEFVLVH